jgi:hypothetical protein
MAGNVEAAEEVLASRYAGEDESVEMMATRGRYESRRGHIEAGEAGYRDAARLACPVPEILRDSGVTWVGVQLPG